MGTGVLQQEESSWGHDADHSPPSGATVKNKWYYKSTPLNAFMARTQTTLPLPG